MTIYETIKAAVHSRQASGLVAERGIFLLLRLRSQEGVKRLMEK